MTRSLEKITTGQSRNSGGNFTLSTADLQHLQTKTASSQHSSVNQQKLTKAGSTTGTSGQQYRGTQPQQKQKIKAFKRGDQTMNLASALDVQKLIMNQVSVSSVVSRTSGKRPSSNFVSQSGQSRTTTGNVESSSQGGGHK